MALVENKFNAKSSLACHVKTYTPETVSKQPNHTKFDAHAPKVILDSFSKLKQFLDSNFPLKMTHMYRKLLSLGNWKLFSFYLFPYFQRRRKKGSTGFEKFAEKGGLRNFFEGDREVWLDMYFTLWFFLD